MSCYPVLPAIWLVVVSAVLVIMRIAALYRLILRTGAGRYRHVVTRWSGLTLAVILLVVAACRPGFDSDPAGPSPDSGPPNADPNVNVFFVVDRSVNARVEDLANGKPRMSGMRADMSALIDEYPQARFAVISYAAKASMDWPLSDDAWSLHSVVAGLSPYTVVAPGAAYQTDAVAARDVLRASVSEAAKIFPGSRTLVFYLGAGAANSRVPTAAFDLGRARVAGGAVLGYGTPVGGPIPRGLVNGRTVYEAGPDGSGPLNSSIDEGRLQAIAAELDVPYFHRESGQSISGVAPRLDSSAGARDNSVTHLIGRRELYWVFALVAAALLLAEMVLTVREYRRNRMSTRVGAR